MSEIEKLYINARVEKEWRPLPYGGIDEFYPQFTEVKQFKLYKYLCKLFLITTRYYFDEFFITAENTFEEKGMTATGKTYEECIAKLVNNLWQDLTEEEKQQVKRILE